MAEQDPHPHPPTKMTEHDHEKPPPQDHRYAAGNRRQTATKAIVILLLIAGITALTLWLIYRPHKPKFKVISAAVYDLNTTTTTTPPPLISTTMQFTVVTRNPNRRVSISYDNLSAFVSYLGQEITPAVPLPPLFHETKSTVALSPVIGGVAVPVAAEVVNGLLMDEGYGAVGLRLVIAGKLRYKAAVAVRRGRRGVYVKCDLFVGLKNGFVGPLPLLASPPCTVDVSN